MKKFLLILLALPFFLACSQQVRTQDPGIDDAILFDEMYQILGEAGLSSGGANDFRSIADEQLTTIYFSENTESFGTAESVLSMYYLDFLSPGLVHDNIAEVRTYFLDLNLSDSRRNALMIDLILNDGRVVTKIFNQVGESLVEDDIFSVEVSDGQTTLVLSTRDLEDGSTDLDPTIQLEMDIFLDGQLEYLGKLPSIVGFGGI